MTAGLDGRALLLYARSCLESVVRNGTIPTPDALGKTSDGAGLFVTLRKGRTLRGCVGDTGFTFPVEQLIGRMTMAAATSDPRFPPVSSEELAVITIEISVLSRPRAAEVSEVITGRHGVLVQDGSMKGLLLPSVADELQCEAEELVQLACQKAGFPRGAKPGKDFTLKVFEAEVFEE